jgi:hypothetical protein
MRNAGSLSRETREILETMGVTLLQLQMAENLIRLCLTFVLQKNTPLTLESLQEQTETERNKTIGYFLSELRKRAALHEGFDDALKTFLRNRNTFVHDLSRVPGWGTRTQEQIVVARTFLHGLIRQTDQVCKVFAGLVMAWQKEAGISVPVPDHAWFAEVRETYQPLVDRIFTEKDS